MEIEFYFKETGVTVIKETSNNNLFVMNDQVWRDNLYSCESQEPTVDFFDFVEECNEIDWRVIR